MTSLLPPPTAIKPARSTFRNLPLLLSLTILYFFHSPLLPSPDSLFQQYLPRSALTAPRKFATYPYAHVCSSQARHHFLTRHARPSRPLFPPKPKSLQEAQNRVLMSCLPKEVGDGLGHRLAMINYELHLALMLDVAYIHRGSTYGSLTREKETVVDEFFGWPTNLTREKYVWPGCTVDSVSDTCEMPSPSMYCSRLLSRAKGGVFDQTVFIPTGLSDCLLQPHPDTDKVQTQCYPFVKSFMTSFPQANTLFQMTPGRCFHHYLYTNFSLTADWFAEKYWQRGKLSTLSDLQVSVAVHIRRGDFFEYSNRVLIADNTYVDVVWRVKIALDEILGRDVPLVVRIYSEGIAERIKDNHDTASQKPIYVDEHGNQTKKDHFEKLFTAHRRNNGGSLSVSMHIAEDTVQSLHDMLAADVFVGSISGLSMQVVRYIGRGVMLLPLHESEIGLEERVVPWDYGRGSIDSWLDEMVLYQRLAEAVRRDRLACMPW